MYSLIIIYEVFGNELLSDTCSFQNNGMNGEVCLRNYCSLTKKLLPNEHYPL